MYIPSYTNFSSFLCGMIGGIVYKKHENNYKTFSKRAILVILWYAMIPIATVLLLSAFIFYEYDFTKPAIWIAIYAAQLKSLWGFLVASLITGMAFGFGCRYNGMYTYFENAKLISRLQGSSRTQCHIQYFDRSVD